MKAEIVIIGTEILLGEIVDTKPALWRMYGDDDGGPAAAPPRAVSVPDHPCGVLHAEGASE